MMTAMSAGTIMFVLSRVGLYQTRDSTRRGRPGPPPFRRAENPAVMASAYPSEMVAVLASAPSTMNWTGAGRPASRSRANPEGITRTARTAPVTRRCRTSRSASSR
jgi:hypothetical protein